MIKLFQFPPAWELLSISPFCVKASAFLKWSKLEHQVVNLMSPAKAPLGKLPYIEDEGEIIADSSAIIDYLIGKYQIQIDVNLKPYQLAQAEAIKSLIEDNLYFIMVDSRWIDEPGARVMKAAFKTQLPPVICNLVFKIVQRMAKKRLHQQGMGRYKKETVYAKGEKAIIALSEFLGDSDFFMGESISVVDFSAYAFLVSILEIPIDNPLQQKVKALPKLVAYCKTMEAQWS